MGLQKFCKTSKRLKVSFKITNTQSPSQEKHEQLLNNDFFDDWASVDCNGVSPLTEPRNEK